MVFPTNPSSPTEILNLLPSKFKQARESGELFFFESTVKDVHSSGFRFNLRCCPALLDKSRAKAEALAALKRGKETGSPDHKRPRTTSRTDASSGDDPEASTKQNRAEPFKPPYVEELYVGCLEGLEGEDGMSILLNKYSLLPEHMLLCPQSYQPQSLPPTPGQLALAYLVLLAASRHPTNPRRLLAFYNGGEGAGASQTWRHLQFVDVPAGGAPVDEWVRGLSFDRQDTAIVHPRLPHLHIIHPLPPSQSFPFPPSPDATSQLIDVLAPALMKSLDIVFDALRAGGAGRDGGWNLLMTLDHLHLIPRSAPSFPLPTPHEPLELNSLGYAGMMLVRSAEEEATLLQAVEGEGGLMRVLERCGVPRQWGESALMAQQAQVGHNEETLAL